MRHRARSAKLGRNSAHRRAMFRNLVTSLLDHERVETTDVKAKEVRRLADRMITLGKRGTLHARRRALRVIRDRAVAAKVFDELADRYRSRPGGYTRVLKTRVRVGDAAPLSIVELVEGAPAPPEPRGRGRKKAGASKASGRKAEAAGTGRTKATGRKSAGRKAEAESGGKKASRRKSTRKKSD